MIFEHPNDLPAIATSVLLNALARGFFRGRWLTIDERKGWGVTCHYTDAQGDVFHYRASWSEIKEWAA